MYIYIEREGERNTTINRQSKRKNEGEGERGREGGRDPTLHLYKPLNPKP